MSVLKIKTSENTWEKVNSIPSIPIDTTLTQSGVAADSKTVGDKLAEKQPIGDYAIKSELGALANKNNVSKSDLDTELQETLDKIGELPSDFTETDPTVPAWAKEQNKPSYTATEVGADPTGTAIETVSSHNSDPEAHEEIRNLIGEKVYSQNDEPVDAEDGSLWVDMDAVGSVGSGSSESSDIFVVTIDYEHNTASHSASEIRMACESGKIAVIDNYGAPISLVFLTEDEAIFQRVYDVGVLHSAEIRVGEDKQVTIYDEDCSVEVPYFNFADMGMSPIPMPAGTVTFVHDMTDIMESLANGAVSIRVPCSSDGVTTVYFDCHVLGHTQVGTDRVQVSVPAFLYNQVGESIGNFLVTATIFADRAIINVEPLNASGGGGYIPVRGVDYWTDEDKAEIKSYVDEAILGGAW